MTKETIFRKIRHGEKGRKYQINQNKMAKYKVHIIWAVIVVVALVGGIWYGKSSVASKAASATAARSGYGRTGAASGGFVSGQIISVSSSSLTISLANGNSQVVFYSGSTQIMKPTAVPASALAAGTRVMIGGVANSDGSLTAQSIQVTTGGGFSGGSGAAGGGAGAGTGSGQ
jgi:hypothetical protein